VTGLPVLLAATCIPEHAHPCLMVGSLTCRCGGWCRCHAVCQVIQSNEVGMPLGLRSRGCCCCCWRCPPGAGPCPAIRACRLRWPAGGGCSRSNVLVASCHVLGGGGGGVTAWR
jgi:hypothetical protein